MSLTNLNSKFLLPSLIVLSFFLAACSATSPQTSDPLPTSDISQISPSAETTPVEGSAIDSTQTLATVEGTQTTSKTVFYNNPAGGDEVGFEVTTDQNGVITAVKTDIKAVHDISVRMQTNFAGEVESAVVGKKIAELKIDRIGGASLTTGAFKQFLSEINS